MNIPYGIRDIEVFIRVIDSGSFKEAAAFLNVTQSALTQRLQKLEDAVGAKLIDRTTRSIALTAVGRAFLPAARRMLNQFEQAYNDIRDVIDVAGGRVTISSLISVATYVLPDVIGRFAEDHPNVGIRVIDVSEQEIMSYVRRGEAEFAIDMRTDDIEEGLVTTPLMEDGFVLACRDDHPHADGGTVDAGELSGMPLMILGARSGTSRVLQAHLTNRATSAKWLYEVQHLSTMVGFLEAGMGVGIIPRMVMRGVASRRLVSRPLHGPSLSRTLELVERRGATLSPAAEQLKQMILAEFTELAKAA
ncbi:MAG: LysR family transcriptional regulator [Rhodospirillales bacterium]|nr:LysR family transcriptional regulator [Rhodospirillales bacterium]MBO6785779.1 LysR family transcriptional regulator [Rhodospirillales bacterium]